MDLRLDPRLASGYHSRSQSARVMTEAWFEQNVYCPACPSEELTRLPDNMKVLDFQCPDCEETYQLKSTKGEVRQHRGGFRVSHEGEADQEWAVPQLGVPAV